MTFLIFLDYPFPDLIAGTDGFGVLGAGADGLGATGVEGLGETGVLGLEIDGLAGLGSLGSIGSFEPPRLIAGLVASVGLAIELSLLSELGLSTVVFGLPIV